jgi:hypothetical protein
MKTSLSFVIIVLPLSAIAQAWADDPPDRAKLEKQFAEKLSGAKLMGHWTLWGKEAKPQQDTYTLGKVAKLKGDNWLFEARIEYGDVNVKVPVTVQVKWAGDTPVIVVDKLGIPLLGTYSARLVFHGDHYAGTWDGGDHGGHMYGKVVKGKEEPKSKNKAESKPKKEPAGRLRANRR